MASDPYLWKKISKIFGKSVDDFYSKKISKVICETPLRKN